MNRTYAFALGALSFVFVAGGMTAWEQSGSPAKPAASMATHAPSASPASSTDPQAAASLKARADDLRERGEIHQALETYQSAVRQDPTDVGIRFAVAQLFAQLNRRAEAITAYTWIVQNAMPGSEITRQAEHWLKESGSASDTAGDANAQGRLTGRVTWTNLDPNRAVPAVTIVLEGNDAVTNGEVYSTKSVMNGNYEFKSIKPGGYHLVAKSQMVKIWEHDIVVQGGGTVMDLEPSQAVAPPDALLAKSGS
jgi:hypothetical protein